MNDEQLEILTEIFRTLFNNPELNLDDELVATDVPGWDSFNHINLIINIEEEFGVKFTNAEVGKMQNVGDLKKILAIKISA
jgi:acyl carrier protein